MRSRLPYQPMGDLSDADMSYLKLMGHGGPHLLPADVAMGFAELGDVNELGEPLTIDTSQPGIDSTLAATTPATAAKAIQTVAQTAGPAAADAVRAATVVKNLAKNHSLPYEQMAGGRIVSSTLGPHAMLGASMIAELKHAIHSIPPFEPQTFTYQPVGPNFVVDYKTALFGVIGSTQQITMAGFIVTLQASVFNTQMGAFMTMVRGLGAAPTALSVTNLIQLESGARNVQLLVLNGQIVAGRPRAFFPTFFPNAAPDPTLQSVLIGLPTNYAATLRFMQPGDEQVNFFLSKL